MNLSLFDRTCDVIGKLLIPAIVIFGIEALVTVQWGLPLAADCIMR